MNLNKLSPRTNRTIGKGFASFFEKAKQPRTTLAPGMGWEKIRNATIKKLETE